jgi:hypothetical protein
MIARTSRLVIPSCCAPVIGGAAAAQGPHDVRDIIGERAAKGENELRSRGYVPVRC